MKNMKCLVEKVSGDFPSIHDGVIDIQLDLLWIYEDWTEWNIWNNYFQTLFECREGKQGRTEIPEWGEVSLSVVSFFGWRQNFRYGTGKGDLKKGEKYIAILLSWRDRSKFRKAEVSGLRTECLRREGYTRKSSRYLDRISLSLSWKLTCACTGGQTIGESINWTPIRNFTW